MTLHRFYYSPNSCSLAAHIVLEALTGKSRRS
jgi:hypothetical protein